MTVKEENFAIDSRRGQTLMAAGGLLGALAASSCCILPVVLFNLGVSGAWIGNFNQLAPYQPYFLAATLVFLGTGYWLVHRAFLEGLQLADSSVRITRMPTENDLPVHLPTADWSRPGATFWIQRRAGPLALTANVAVVRDIC